jgi:hypothetical protein
MGATQPQSASGALWPPPFCYPDPCK